LRKLLTALFSLFFLISLSQSTALDSLDARIKATTNASQKVELLWVAADLAYDEDVSQVDKFTKQLLENPIVKADSAKWIEALRLQSLSDRKTGRFASGIDGFQTCYNYYILHHDTTNWITAANQLGSMNLFTGYNEAAQKYLLEVYELEKERGDEGDLAHAINGLAIFYNNTGQLDKAVTRYNEALRIFEAVDDTLGRANVHANLGLTLMDLGRLDEAEFHIKMQGKLDTLLGTMWGLGFFHDFMGQLKKEQGNLRDAYEYHKKALQIRESLPSHYNISESRTSVASSLYDLGEYTEAIVQANMVIENDAEHQSLSHQQRAYSVLSKANEALGNFSEALRYHKQYKAISDSIFNADILEKVAEKDAKFELVEQRAKVDVLNAQNAASQAIIDQKNRALMFGGIGLIIVTVLSCILYFLVRKYLRQKFILAKAVSDKDLLLREIHHRVKNNLQMVSSLLSLQSRSIDDETALKAINDGKSRVRSMAIIHQDLYQQDNLTGVNVQSYLEKLCSELFATYNINDEEIQLKLDIENIDADVDTLVPLGLIINELVTNSLKYAFQGRENGVVSISLKEQSNLLLLIVSDNGIGYNESDILATSFGNKLVASLAKQLKATITTKNDDGSSTTLEISNYKVSKR